MDNCKSKPLGGSELTDQCLQEVSMSKRPLQVGGTWLLMSVHPGESFSCVVTTSGGIYVFLRL